MFLCFFVTVCVATSETNESQNVGLLGDFSSISEILGALGQGGRSLDLPCRTLEISDDKNDYFSCKEKVLRSRLNWRASALT